MRNSFILIPSSGVVVTIVSSCKSIEIGLGNPVDLPSPDDCLKSIVKVLSTSSVN